MQDTMSRLIYGIVFGVMVFVSGNISAPLENAGLELKNLKSTKHKQNTELDLQSLLKSNDMQKFAYEVKSSSVDNSNNGVHLKKETINKEIVNKDDGKVVSDIKQEITKTSGKEETPKIHVKTEIDIPSKGIHKVIEKDNAVESDDLPKRTGDLTDFSKQGVGIIAPSEMAEYLYTTQNFATFADYLIELLDSNAIGRQAADLYYEAVKDAYSQLYDYNTDAFSFRTQTQIPEADYFDDIITEKRSQNAVMQDAMNEYLSALLDAAEDYPYPDYSPLTRSELSTILRQGNRNKNIYDSLQRGKTDASVMSTEGFFGSSTKSPRMKSRIAKTFPPKTKISKPFADKS